MKNYDDIINLPHHTSATRQRMSISDRAAQFAPFAALTGYDGVIEETVRQTDSQDESNEESAALLDRKLRILKENESERAYVEITYFVPDERKSGGRYETVYGYLKTVDEIECTLTLMDKRRIPFDRIRSLDSTLFNEMFFD